MHPYIGLPCQKDKMLIGVRVLPCPLGFALSYKERLCVCETYVSKFVQNCYIDSLSIEHMQNNFWVSKVDDSTVVIHGFCCPLDYCTVNPVNVTLDKSAVQCDFNWNGTLCGHCQKHYSLALGSLHCLSCDNRHIALILPFALVGVLVVALVFLFQLTVAVGTLNGLLFYVTSIKQTIRPSFQEAQLTCLPCLYRG